ncbi:MAG: twin-arginine translocase TatA/TatE family subunit [Armatimonadetes bacterium]|nr:twin-arginine translocase TatA/TatE family subunit [Armatimonadota bacterium]
MGPFGMNEMIVVLLVVLLLFGGKKIPELFRAMGKGVSEFKKGVEEGKADPKADPLAPPEIDADTGKTS